MAEYQIIPKATLDAIEESIQRKRGETAPISPSQMPLAIDTIPSSADGTDVPVGGIYFTKPDSNGNPTECYIIGYAASNAYKWENQLSRSYFPYLSKIMFVNCENITQIGANAFSYSSNIAEVSLPNGLKELGATSFGYCSSLKTINIPSTLVSIGVNAFLSCGSLENVIIESGFNCNNLNLSASTRYTAETIVSWLEALADRTGQATFTLTIGATNLNKLTAEQKAIATNKNWTLA